MAVSDGALGAATIAFGQSVGAFQIFLPRLSDVRRATNDADMIGDVRMGEVAAAAVCLGVGFMVSSLSGSSIPALVSLLTMFTLVCVYETALRGDKPLNPQVVKDA